MKIPAILVLTLSMVACSGGSSITLQDQTASLTSLSSLALMKAKDLPQENNEDLLDTVEDDDKVLVALDKTGTAHLVLMGNEQLFPVEQLFVTKKLVLLDVYASDVRDNQDRICRIVVIKKDTGELHCISDVSLGDLGGSVAGDRPIRENRSGDIVGFFVSGGDTGVNSLVQISVPSNEPQLGLKTVFSSEDSYTEEFAINDVGDFLVQWSPKIPRELLYIRKNGTSTVLGEGLVPWCAVNSPSGVTNDFLYFEQGDDPSTHVLMQASPSGTTQVGQWSNTASHECQRSRMTDTHTFVLESKANQADWIKDAAEIATGFFLQVLDENGPGVKFLQVPNTAAVIDVCLTDDHNMFVLAEDVDGNSTILYTDRDHSELAQPNADTYQTLVDYGKYRVKTIYCRDDGKLTMMGEDLNTNKSVYGVVNSGGNFEFLLTDLPNTTLYPL